ncbi:hypothetical protein F5X99DRAFT_430004 [Biscogniauxia marginata]|nr:hypothetical protein F5X99DRAFT_430004 [Biscogniauxia marginata]
MADVPRYCISQARCRLCQFRLEDGELVVAAVGDQDAVSPEFSFHRDTSFYDKKFFGAEVHMCCQNRCMFRTRSVDCFHSGCYTFRLFPVSPDFLAATEYSFQPPICEERRRRDLIQQNLVERLKQTQWPRNLPDELWLLTAQYLVRECAIVTVQELTIQPRVCDSVFDLSRDVYVQYVMFEGARYLKSIKNSGCAEAKQEGQLLLDARRARTVQKVYIAEDHLGIRHIQFISSDDKSSRSSLDIPGVWWRTICRPNSIKIRAKTDVHLPRIRWQTPTNPVAVVDLATLQRPQQYPAFLRMGFSDCNAPDITGYSIAVTSHCVATIHAHRRDTGLGFYQEVDASFRAIYWIHMPIDEGEYVTEICRPLGFKYMNRYDTLGLTFTTNRGRTTVFGSHSQILREGVQFDRVYSPPETPTRIFFNTWDSLQDEKEIKFLAYSNPEPPAPRPLPISAIPIWPVQNTRYNELWYYSSCAMRGITEITLCVNRNLPHKPITGMLLRYEDGHKACVGQMRLDWTLRPIVVGQAGKLRIGSLRTEKRFLYVAIISVRERVDRDDCSWLDVPWHGTLEWWFSLRNTVIRYSKVERNS